VTWPHARARSRPSGGADFSAQPHNLTPGRVSFDLSLLKSFPITER
jgi:hypothetical protein